MFENKREVIDYINTLKDYEGYVQFSHRKIDLQKDIFPCDGIEDEEGFIYEAHFCKDNQSIMIKQLNDKWIVSKTDITNAEIETFYGIDKLKIKMAQVWQKEKDSLCLDMEVLKLKKVVFAGFEKDEK